jgi:hypothetical protein
MAMMMMMMMVLHTTTIILAVLALPLQSSGGVVAAFGTVGVVIEPKKSSRIAPPPPANRNDDDNNKNNNNNNISGQARSRRSALSHMTAGIMLTFSSFSPRRALAASSTIAEAAASSTSSSSSSSSSTGRERLENVYFGAGCFWHVQHEMILAERTILNRKDEELTSLTGYAGGGGRGTDDQGRVCYHNVQSIADYGKLGHGEVVGMTVPTNTVGEFAEEYFKLFDGNKGERADPMDKGGEYR